MTRLGEKIKHDIKNIKLTTGRQVMKETNNETSEHGYLNYVPIYLQGSISFFSTEMQHFLF